MCLIWRGIFNLLPICAAVLHRLTMTWACFDSSYFLLVCICLHLILGLEICWLDSLSRGSQNPAAAKDVLTVLTAAWCYTQQIHNRLKTKLLILKRAVAFVSKRENLILRCTFVCCYRFQLNDCDTWNCSKRVLYEVFPALYTGLINQIDFSFTLTHDLDSGEQG